MSELQYGCDCASCACGTDPTSLPTITTTASPTATPAPTLEFTARQRQALEKLYAGKSSLITSGQ